MVCGWLPPRIVTALASRLAAWMSSIHRSTLGEFPALGLPSVLVPYPYSGQHQDVNADFLVARGAAIKIADADLSAQLRGTVIGLLQDPVRMQEMRQAASSLARPDAAARIAQELRHLAAGKRKSGP